MVTHRRQPKHTHNIYSIYTHLSQTRSQNLKLEFQPCFIYEQCVDRQKKNELQPRTSFVIAICVVSVKLSLSSLNRNALALQSISVNRLPPSHHTQLTSDLALRTRSKQTKNTLPRANCRLNRQLNDENVAVSKPETRNYNSK